MTNHRAKLDSNNFDSLNRIQQISNTQKMQKIRKKSQLKDHMGATL